MSSTEAINAPKIKLIAKHIIQQRQRVLGQAVDAGTRPLIVGFQGPQGSGKTTLTTQLKAYLHEQHQLQAAIFSIDDLYLTHAELTELAKSHRSNKLLQGRGQPGTHDIDLGRRCLKDLLQINVTKKPAELPVFDKSQHGGDGDRSAKTVTVSAPLDVVLFEGWCLGFGGIGTSELTRRCERAASIQAEDKGATTTGPYYLKHSLESLKEIDVRLGMYEAQWYPLLDAFVQLRPVVDGSSASAESSDPTNAAAALENVFQWRLQAEHAMKAANGGKGMTDEQVRAFVERYMPGYELFSEYVASPRAPWHGKGLRIDIDRSRALVSTTEF